MKICLQYDVSALYEALSVDDAVDEDARYLDAALLQAHGQALQDKKWKWLQLQTYIFPT